MAQPIHSGGVTLRLGTKVEGFTAGADGRVGAVATSAGELECDAVIVCLHKLPNSGLAEAAGVRTGTTGGIVVDERMHTSADAVWAAGDVVEVPHGLSMIPIRGLTGSHAYAQGRTAAFNAAGQDLEVLELACGTFPTTLFDTQLAAGFAGYATPSLAALAEQVVGVRLPKGDRLTDWEFAHIGDPREDLGYYNAYSGAVPPNLLADDVAWTEPGGVSSVSFGWSRSCTQPCQLDSWILCTV